MNFLETQITSCTFLRFNFQLNMNLSRFKNFIGCHSKTSSSNNNMSKQSSVVSSYWLNNELPLSLVSVCQFCSKAVNVDNKILITNHKPPPLLQNGNEGDDGRQTTPLAVHSFICLWPSPFFCPLARSFI